MNQPVSIAPSARIDPESGLPVLDMPADGVPQIVDTAQALARAARTLAAGTGPVAIDTERAHGYRYLPRAYLIQLRRRGSGTHLVDPVALDIDGLGSGLGPLAEALSGTEWILHAATQDMPCLAMEGLRPHAVFDTELAGRLLNLPRVGLGAMVEHYLGVHLLKEHSAADWSRRPLPADWLVYAALDVELLDELRARVLDDLRSAGKLAWAEQEFEHLAAIGAGLPATPGPTDPQRWRRATGLHDVPTRAGLQVVKDLWWARDAIARETDIAPGRIVNDRALTGFAAHCGERVTLTSDDLARSSGLGKGRARRYADRWRAALAASASTRPADYPPKRVRHDGPPPPRSWERHHPDEAARWERIRPAMNALAETLDLPPENLISPECLRQLCWAPPRDDSPLGVDAFLADLGARRWQRDAVAGPLSRLLRA